MTSDADIDVLARTMWGEARGDGRAGMEAVAWVVMNRVANPGWWGHDIQSVCQAPWQFSCWNINDPNHAKLLAVRAPDPMFLTAEIVAQGVANHVTVDTTGGADSYYAVSMTEPPKWVATAKFTKQIGRQRFYITRDMPDPVAGMTPDELDELYNQGA